MISSFMTKSAIFFEFKPIWCFSFISSGIIIATFANITSQSNYISHSPIPRQILYNNLTQRQNHAFVAIIFVIFDYAITSDTVPAPTVTRPSLIANLSCGSIAIGLPSST